MRTIGDKLRNGKDPVHHFDRQGTVYCVYRVVTATKSTLAKRKGHSTHAKTNTSAISKISKSAFAKQALE